jgi:glucokinase
MAGAKSAIGIDIGGTATKVARVSAEGAILRLKRLQTTAQGDPAPYLDALRNMVVGIIGGEPVAGVGLSLNGFLSDDLRSSVFNPNTPALVGVDFGRWLEGFGVPFCIEEDLNAPAVAEYHFGEYAGAPRLMAASIGTGFGAGMVVGGQVLRLYAGQLGDTGHIILEPGGPACSAGCRGCAEALISVAGIERLASRDGLRETAAREVISAAREGEPKAAAVIAQIGTYLGQWLASAAPIFMPDQVVICGGIAEAGAPLLEAAVSRYHELAGATYARAQISLSRFGGLAGVIGAVAPLLKEDGR